MFFEKEEEFCLFDEDFESERQKEMVWATKEAIRRQKPQEKLICNHEFSSLMSFVNKHQLETESADDAASTTASKASKNQPSTQASAKKQQKPKSSPTNLELLQQTLSAQLAKTNQQKAPQSDPTIPHILQAVLQLIDRKPISLSLIESLSESHKTVFFNFVFFSYEIKLQDFPSLLSFVERINEVMAVFVPKKIRNEERIKYVFKRINKKLLKLFNNKTNNQELPNNLQKGSMLTYYFKSSSSNKRD